MKKLKPFILGICLTGFVSAPAMATVSADNSDNSRYQQISSQTKSLQAELSTLQKELRALKSQLKTSDNSELKTASAETGGKTILLASSDKVIKRHRRQTSARTQRLHSKRIQNQQNVQNTQNTQNSPVTESTASQEIGMIHESATYLPFDLDVPGQAFVSTGPYVGVPIQYAGSNLIINSPSVNTDLQLLGIRKHIIEQLTALGGENFKEPYHSHLLLSGLVEAQADYFNHSGRANGGAPSSDIDVTNVSIDFTFLGPSDWILGFIELTYDNATPQGSVFVSPSQFRVLNSRVFVNKAFITIGDLVKSPFYGSFGQFYVPFGAYSSFMVSSPFTQVLTRTKARSILVGFQQQGKNALYGSAYVFRGDTHVSSTSRIGNGGINLGYKYAVGPLAGNIGGGWIGNIADSVGLQVGNLFLLDEQIVHRVPGYNLRGNMAFGDHVDIVIEWVTASTRFNPRDMAYDEHGARPWALDAEGIGSFTFFDKPTSIGINYQKSHEALAMGLPLTRRSLVFNTSVWRNTLQSLEFRFDREYAASRTGGNAGDTPAPSQTGRLDKAVTAQFDYYF